MMENRLAQFSDFVRDAHARAAEFPVHTLANWAVRELSNRIGFDAGWYGWAQISRAGVEIHANSTWELPPQFYETWSEISSQDLLARGILDNPGHASSYDRKGAQQTDGMVALSDRFGLTQMATAMHIRPGRRASFYMSAYRTGAYGSAWSREDREFLQCAVEQLSLAMENAQTIGDHPYEVTIFVNPQGITIHGLRHLKRKFGNLWPCWDTDILPDCLENIIAHDGTHSIDHLGLVGVCSPAPGAADLGLRRLTLRRISVLDRLSPREHQVVRALVDGLCHKGTARLLGIAPATVRNQIQSIYGKLEVDNRASLTALVHRGI
jgi:DNA-binding CsgD family transcriptional regulator